MRERRGAEDGQPTCGIIRLLLSIALIEGGSSPTSCEERITLTLELHERLQGQVNIVRIRPDYTAVCWQITTIRTCWSETKR